MQISTDKIKHFWSWFASIEADLAANVENESLLKELDEQVYSLDLEISWELGPGRDKEWFLAISPNLRKDLLEETELIVSMAPDIAKWEFLSATPVKDWNYKFELPEDRIEIDMLNWKCIVIPAYDSKYDVFLISDDSALIPTHLGQTVCEIALKSILGERVLIEKINNYKLQNRSDINKDQQLLDLNELKSKII